MTRRITWVRGRVGEGCGKVSQLGMARLLARQRFCGMRLVPGTLNVRPWNGVKAALHDLGEPPAVMRTELEDMAWWPVIVRASEDALAPILGEGFIIRSPLSRAGYLEVVSDVHFRSKGVGTGDFVILEQRA